MSRFAGDLERVRARIALMRDARRRHAELGEIFRRHIGRIESGQRRFLRRTGLLRETTLLRHATRSAHVIALRLAEGDIDHDTGVLVVPPFGGGSPRTCAMVYVPLSKSQ